MDCPSLLTPIASSEKTSENSTLTFSAMKSEEPCGGKIKLIWRFQRNGSKLDSSETGSASQPEKQSSLDSTQPSSVSETLTNRQLTFALSKEEIEADIQAISGDEQRIKQSPIESPTPKREKAKKNQKRPRFSFALSLEEIEADFRAVTGRELPIQLKKRAKRIPKEIERLFPSVR